MSAADLGTRLLAEVEEVGFDEILNTLRLQDRQGQIYSDLPQLNSFLQCMLESQNGTSKTASTAPIVEITSQKPCSGKTSLLYYLIATAILPLHLGGRQSAVVFVDTDNHFSVIGLAQQLRRTIATNTRGDTTDPKVLNRDIVDSLKHVHVFRPQSLPETITTINNLPAHLFNASQHNSFDRAINFILLDSASAFYWQSRSDLEDAALEASFKTNKPRQPQPSTYIELGSSLKTASRILSTPIIFTTQDFNPPPKPATSTSHFLLTESPSIRPSLPPPWPNFPTLRLIVRRAPIRSLPAGVTVEDAIQETEMRHKVVQQGKFECFVNEWGIDEKTLRRLRKKGNMFEFFIMSDGVKVGDGPE